MERVVRVLAILSLLPRQPRSISAGELQAKLAERGHGRTERSIQRDLQELSQYFPILADESAKPFRWSFDARNGSSTIPALDLPAALTLQLAHAYLAPVLPPRVLAHLEPHFAEAAETLRRTNSALSDWPDRVRMITRGLQTRRPNVDGDVLVNVTEALLKGLQCELLYQARSWPEPRIIAVHPLGLIFREPNIYLIGVMAGREGVRQMLLHRISQCEVLDEYAQRPKDFSLDDYIASGAMAMLKGSDAIDLALRCDKPYLLHLLEAPLSEDQRILEESDEHFILQATVNDTQDLRWWLVAQGSHLDILEPDWLRDEVTALLQAALERQERV